MLVLTRECIFHVERWYEQEETHSGSSYHLLPKCSPILVI